MSLGDILIFACDKTGSAPKMRLPHSPLCWIKRLRTLSLSNVNRERVWVLRSAAKKKIDSGPIKLWTSKKFFFSPLRGPAST